MDGIVVTNGWNAILRELDIAHPAAKLTKPHAFPPCYASLLRIRNGGPGTTSGMAGIGDSRLPLISKQFDISKISQEMPEVQEDDLEVSVEHNTVVIKGIVVTNGWNAILRELDIAHLAAKVIVVGTQGFGHFGTRCEGELKKKELGKARTSLDPPWSVALNGGGWWEVTANKGGDGGAFVCLVAKGGNGGACMLAW
ncbi:hypothetical protein Tco_0871870 [Tanacetum coccineum]